ncbi:MAG TPA: hypothetical protein VMD79_12400 [Solirubrobacteraceae bacterium]|nr:hypothetical protein [Solirubrobacteraceae bacterium]
MQFSVRHIVSAALAIVLAGCGASTSPDLSNQPTTRQAASASVAKTTTQAEVSLPMSYIATTTATAPNTVVSVKYELSALRIGRSANPPQSLLEACGIEAGEVDAVVFAKGQLSVHYVRGSYQVTLQDDLKVSNADSEGKVAYQNGASWLCVNSGQEEEQPPGWNLQPGQVVSDPVWVMPITLSNTHPHLTEEDEDQMILRDYPQIPEAAEGALTEAMSGPRVYDCGGEHLILPWGKQPFIVSGENPMKVECGRGR